MVKAPKNSRFILTSIIAGQWGIIGGLAVIILGIYLGELSTIWSTIVTTIGTTTFTAALVGIIYEAFQKQIFAGDLQGMFNLSASLQGSGILNISEPKSELMSDLFAQRELTIIPLNPFDWYTSHKSMVYQAACSRATNVNLWIPEYDDPKIAEIVTQQLQQTTDELGIEFKRFLRQIEDDWNNAKVHHGSFLQVLSYRDLPRVGVYHGEEGSILEYQAASPEWPTVYKPTWIQVNPSGDFFKWAMSEVSRVVNNPGASTRLVRPSVAATSS